LNETLKNQSLGPWVYQNFAKYGDSANDEIIASAPKAEVGA